MPKCQFSKLAQPYQIPLLTGFLVSKDDLPAATLVANFSWSTYPDGMPSIQTGANIGPQIDQDSRFNSRTQPRSEQENLEIFKKN